jgi:hypothetical protein
MQECWNALPEDRPQFSDLKNKLGSLLSYATEEYGYLDIRKSNGGKYYQMVPSAKSEKESDPVQTEAENIAELDKTPLSSSMSDSDAILLFPPVALPNSLTCP